MSVETMPQTLRHVRRPFFKKGLTYVAVKPIRLGPGNVLDPGSVVEGLRQFHLRSLYQRRLIGIEGDDWTEQQLLAFGERLDRAVTRAEDRGEDPAPFRRLQSTLGLAEPEEEEEHEDDEDDEDADGDE